MGTPGKVHYNDARQFSGGASGGNHGRRSNHAESEYWSFFFGILFILGGTLFAAGKIYTRLNIWKQLPEEEKEKINIVPLCRNIGEVILLSGILFLMVLEQGIIEGRKTYANMIKYIKMTASSNFGNMSSVLAASALLPFLPMMSVTSFS